MLAWISLLDFAGGTGGFTPAVEEPGKRRKGAPRRKYWWEEDRFYLPPHKQDEPLPHEAALKDASEELKAAAYAMPVGEFSRLAGQLGNINRSAKALERKIEAATEIAEVADQYRALGDRIVGYVTKLDDLRDRHIKRLRDEDDRLLELIMKED